MSLADNQFDNPTTENPRFADFIDLSNLLTREQRIDIVKQIKLWQQVQPKDSIVSEAALDTINKFINDSRTRRFGHYFPSDRTEFENSLLDLLEAQATSINNYEKKKTKIKQDHFDQISNFKNISMDNFMNYGIGGGSGAGRGPGIPGFGGSANPNDLSGVDRNNALESYLESHPKLKELNGEFLQALKDAAQQIQHNQDNLAYFLHRNPDVSAHCFDPKKFTNLDPTKFANLNQDPNSIISPQQDSIDQYEQLTQELVDSQEELKKLRDKFIQEWEKIVIKSDFLEEMVKELEEIDRLRKSHMDEYYKRMQKIFDKIKHLEPFCDGDFSKLGRLWDLAQGKWQRVDFGTIERYAKEIEKNPEIQELARILGRFQEAEAEFEMEEYETVSFTHSYKVNQLGRSELVGVTQSNDLNNLLPIELAFLGEKDTEDIFYKKFVENKLQTFQFVSMDQDMKEIKVSDTRSKSKKKEKGPFIIAVDTSGSMHGTPERMAKIITFAVTKIAIQEKRKVYLISFSVQISEKELTNLTNSMEELIEFLNMSFCGGTDITPAAQRSIELMEKGDYENGDLLVVSDGVFPCLNNHDIQRVQKLQKQGNKFYALMIGTSYNHDALGFFNNVWSYQEGRNSLKDLVVIIKNDIAKGHDNEEQQN